MQKLKLIAEKAQRIAPAKYTITDRHSTIKSSQFKDFKDKYEKLGYRIKWVTL